MMYRLLNMLNISAMRTAAIRALITEGTSFFFVVDGRLASLRYNTPTYRKVCRAEIRTAFFTVMTGLIIFGRRSRCHRLNIILLYCHPNNVENRNKGAHFGFVAQFI